MAVGPEVGASSSRTPDGRTRLLQFVDFFVVGVCTLAFALNAGAILTSLLANGFAGQRDFITYWCSGVQLVHHRNPYDEALIGVLERSVGFSPTLRPLIMRNAPYALLAVYPLGFFTLRVASLIWSVCMIGATWWSVRTIDQLYGGRRSKVNLLAIAFAPFLSCIISGQISFLPLLGLTLFLKLHRTRPFAAGAALWLCAMKPQDFVPFAIVLVAWCVVRRAWSVFGGAAAALAASSALVWILDPFAWREYFAMMSAASIPDLYVPCLSTILRLLIRPSAVWLQLVPMVVACAWAAWYFWKHPKWDWLQHSPLLMLVSLVAAPYSWFMDQTILLPALLPVLYGNSSRAAIATFALISGGIELANIFGVPLRNPILYPWTATLWLVWYLWAVRTRKAAVPLDTGSAEMTPVTSVS